MYLSFSYDNMVRTIFMKMSKENLFDVWIFAREELAPVLGITFVHVSVVQKDEGEVSPGGGDALC